jgi:hypothetical protein
MLSADVLSNATIFESTACLRSGGAAVEGGSGSWKVAAEADLAIGEGIRREFDWGTGVRQRP